MPDCKLQGLNWPGVVLCGGAIIHTQPLNLAAGLWQQGVNLVFADEARMVTIETITYNHEMFV